MKKTPKKLSSAFLKAAGHYILVKTPLAAADVCLVFGNNHADHLAEQAADLYHQGYFKTVVVSGGVATDDGRLEALRMRDVLVANGVPVKSILIEDKATNTGENVIYSMALLDKAVGLKNIRSVLAIGHIQASRRFLMTLEKHWPQVVKMFTTRNCFKAPEDLWYTNEAFRKKVLEEYDKVAPYKAQGYIAEIDLEHLAKQIAALPKPTQKGKPHDDHKTNRRLY